MIKAIGAKCIGSNNPIRIGICQCLDMSTLHSKKGLVGKAIKRLNRENKELFGPLISKAKDKPQNQATTEIKSKRLGKNQKPLDGIEFEQKWQKSTKPSVAESTDSLTKDQVVPKYSKASHAPIPPEIIIRNITLFPLLNESKTEDCWRSNMLSLPRESSEDLLLPSVTKVLNATMSENSKAALARWKQKKIEELGEEGFDEYSQSLLSDGREFHSLLESHLTTPEQVPHITQAVTGCWQSLQPVISDVTHVRAVESHVIHGQLKYHGVIDCIAEYRGQPAVIEWKKSDRQKPFLANTYDAPLQAAAYLGAANYDSNYQFPLRSGVVVVAYTDGAPAHVYKMSPLECARYWVLWLQRLQQYWHQQQLSVEAVAIEE